MNTIDTISKLFVIFVGVIQIVILIAIRLNDIKHIEQRISELSKSLMERLNKIDDTLKDHERRLSRIEGKLNGE
ncbi:MAG: hypothetical protein N2Z73_03705 [Endomicrobia bacterium]|nr:hypothetical protein [Endomicrobiia bacterium]